MDPTKSDATNLNDTGDIFNIDVSDFISKYDIDGNHLSTNDSACTKCNSKNLISDYSRGYLVCSVCGLIGDDILYANPEQGVYNLNNLHGPVGRYCKKSIYVTINNPIKNKSNNSKDMDDNSICASINNPVKNKSNNLKDMDDNSQGYISCSMCELIGEDIFYTNLEWKTYDNSNDTYRKMP